MAATKKTLYLPLITLPSQNQLLVMSFKNNKTHKERIDLLLLIPERAAQIQENITIPKTASIEATLTPTDALAEFNRVFDIETEQNYHNFSLRKKMIKALDNCKTFFHTHKELTEYLYRKSREFSVHFLNVQDFVTQFIEPAITTTQMQKMESEFSIKSLCNVSEQLHQAIQLTNTTIYELLGRMKTDKPSELYLTINELKMNCDLENITRNHALRLFNAALDTPDSPPVLKDSISKLLEKIYAIKRTQLDLSDYDQFHFIKCGLLIPSDQQSELINPVLKDRIFTINSYRTERNLLFEFVYTLWENFESRLAINTPLSQ